MAIPLEVRVVILLVLFGAIVWHRVGLYFEERKQREALHQWINDNGLTEYETSLRKFGVQTLKKFANMDVSKFITYHASWWSVFTSQTHKHKLDAAVLKMKKQLELLNWLERKGLDYLYTQFMSYGFTSKEDVLESVDIKTLSSIMENEVSNTDKVFNLLKSDETMDKFSESDSGVSSLVTTPLLLGIRALWWLVLLTVKMILFILAVIVSLCIVNCLGKSIKWAHAQHVYHNVPGQRDSYLVRPVRLFLWLLFVNLHPRRLLTFLSDMIGNNLDPRNCTVQWLWVNPEAVGKTMTFFVKFYRRNRLRYALKEDDPVKIEITYKHTLMSYSMEQSGTNVLKITFTAREAGPYSIAVMIMGKNIRGSPFKKTFLPGPIDPAKCTILESASMLVVQKGIYHPLTVEAKDKYGNVCEITDQDINNYDVKVTKIGCCYAVDPELVILPDSLDRKNVLHIKLEQEGCFDAVVSYERTMLENGKLTIISLSEKEAEEMQKNVSKQLWNVWYEAYILSSEATSSQTSSSSNSATSRSSDRQSSTVETSSIDLNRKKRKVYCYISRRHLTLKEFYMKIIPRRLFTFLIRPRTKLVLCKEDDRYDHPVFTVDDGAQQPICVMCKERNILVATFSRLLLKNIGGSESFADKQNHFYQELVAHHGRKTSNDLKLKIKRSNLLESSYQACKSLFTSDWCRPLMIEFADEEGLDWGGLRREWLELLCVALFAHENKFFTRFNKDDPQAMVHPNPRRPDHKKLKYYEFAGRIVGKCLYESAQGATRRQNVKARFTRSLLAQLLGLRVHYKYFESDDKELYRSKIQYIKDNDPEDLGIVFSEEEYNEQGQLERNVELKPGGAQIAVTQDNKMEYLELLAQWKLATSVSREMEAFQKGLNDIVPDNLLSIFDEYELELLMCGTGNISVSDLKKNCNRAGFGRSYRKVLDWFWTIIGSFTQEELARLIQFVTGSSQLPPGGFAELSPKFQISSSPTRDSLPTAHTCFNQLCLPDYSTCEELQRCLLLAINEGSEGFGMV